MFQIIKNIKNNDINPFLWIGLPIFIPIIFLIFKAIDTDMFAAIFQGEKGIIENGTFAILLIAVLSSFRTLRLINKKYKKKYLYISLLFVLGLIYFAGEEINWGQHWFNWQANDFFERYNDQYIGDTSETNFHNISSWFDQKPRILLTFFVLFGGIYCPLFLSKNNIGDWKYLAYPSFYCFPSSIVCLLFYLLDNSYKFLCYGKPGFDISCNYIPTILYLRTSEIIELYISLFLLIYILSINIKLKKI